MAKSSPPSPSSLEILVKNMEDEVHHIRTEFERGLSARNSGARVSELERWRSVRASASRLSSLAADLVAEVVDR